jgi:protein ECT2
VKNLRTSTRATPPPMVRGLSPASTFRRLIKGLGQTKEAQARMQEMQRLIGRRAVENPTRPRPISMATDSVLPKVPDTSRAEDVAKSMDELASHVDSDLTRAAQSLKDVHSDLNRLTATLVEVHLLFLLL